MDQMRRELLTWSDVDTLIDHLVPQFEGGFDYGRAGWGCGWVLVSIHTAGGQDEGPE